MSRRKKPRYWLFKSEPDEFSFDDLCRAPERTARWDGVRNYRARNLLRDEVRTGDQVFFYHSSTTPPHVFGLAEVVRDAYPDPSQFDADSPYFDPKSKAEAPRWVAVDVRAVRPLARRVTLEEIKANAKLAQMAVVQRGQRLSVQPVTEAEWHEVLRMAGEAEG